ncbi:MAG: NHL repeat-containing protein [Caldilineaceae bacterium]
MGAGDGQFNEPWGVAIDQAGRIYVSDTWNGRVQVFDSDGKFVEKWGTFNTTNGELADAYALFGPRGIAIDMEGNVLVADTGNKRVIKYTPDGQLIQQVGGGGVIGGRFEEPVGVAVSLVDGAVMWPTPGISAFRSCHRNWNLWRNGRQPVGIPRRSTTNPIWMWGRMAMFM